MVWWYGISNTYRKSDFEYTTKKGGGKNRREREYPVFCLLRTSLHIQGQWIYASVLSIPWWTVQPKTKTVFLRWGSSLVASLYDKAKTVVAATSACCVTGLPPRYIAELKVPWQITFGCRSHSTGFLTVLKIQICSSKNSYKLCLEGESRSDRCLHDNTANDFAH